MTPPPAIRLTTGLNIAGSLHATHEYRKALSRAGFSLSGLVSGKEDQNRQAEACPTKNAVYRRQHESGVHPPQPTADADDPLAEEEPPEDLPALKTESCSVRRSLAHLGHATFCFGDITIDS
jgi:hypothetical protein